MALAVLYCKNVHPVGEEHKIFINALSWGEPMYVHELERLLAKEMALSEYSAAFIQVRKTTRKVLGELQRCGLIGLVEGHIKVRCEKSGNWLMVATDSTLGQMLGQEEKEKREKEET